jgi:organic radical activating enzyme
MGKRKYLTIMKPPMKYCAGSTGDREIQMINADMLKDKDVVLTPFVLDSVLLYHRLKRDGVKVCMFFDRNPRLWNERYDDIPIVRSYHRERAVVIVCSEKYKEEMTQALLYSYPESDVPDSASVETQSDEYAIIDEVDEDRYAALAFYEAHYTNGIIIPHEMILGIGKLKLIRTLSGFTPENRKSAWIIPQFNVRITDRCTLRCNGCCALSQYFVNPVDIALPEIIEGLSRFFQIVDFVGTLSLLGGEPLIHKKFGNILKYIAESKDISEKTGTVVVYTNATMLPDKETIYYMKAISGMFMISNYGSVSGKINDLIDILARNGVKYHVMDLLKPDSWAVARQIVESAPTNDAITEAKCKECLFFSYGCMHLRGSRFYPCTFLQAADALRCIPFDNRNFIDLQTKNLSKCDFVNFVDSVFPGCAWCTGYSQEQHNNCRGLAAVQLSKPKAYRKYQL